MAFGFEVDSQSEKKAENSIKGLKNLATKLLGVIGIGFSIAGLSNLAETAAEAEALKSQFSQVFGEMEDEAASKLAAIEEDTGVMVNRMKGSFTQIAAFKDGRSGAGGCSRYCKPVNDSGGGFRCFL